MSSLEENQQIKCLTMLAHGLTTREKGYGRPILGTRLRRLRGRCGAGVRLSECVVFSGGFWLRCRLIPIRRVGVFINHCLRVGACWDMSGRENVPQGQAFAHFKRRGLPLWCTAWHC